LVLSLFLSLSLSLSLSDLCMTWHNRSSLETSSLDLTRESILLQTTKGWNDLTKEK
jgi:hypothetical protein